MRVWLMVTAVAAAVIVACGGEGTPQTPTPTLSEEEAWSLVVEKVVAACPNYAARMSQSPHKARYTDGRWDFFTGNDYGIRFTVYERTWTVTGDS